MTDRSKTEYLADEKRDSSRKLQHLIAYFIHIHNPNIATNSKGIYVGTSPDFKVINFLL